MKLTKKADGKQILQMTRTEWEKIGKDQKWMEVEAKEMKHSPKEHGFIDECIEKNKDKDNPGAYCASIVDKTKGSTDWRKGPKKKG